MELRDARKINSKELYDHRRQAVLLFAKGLKRYEIVPLVGVSAYTVGQWIKAWKKGGQAALKVGNKGRPRGLYRKLLPHEEREIRCAITDRCPDQLKLPFVLWTRQAVQTRIKQKYSVDLSLQAVSNYLNMYVGFFPQKPIWRTYERNDQRVRIWLEKTYPAIAARARQEKAEIHWGDETGLRSDDVKGRSYAPKGKTLVQYVKAAPEKLNMISTVTNRELMRFMFYRETMTAQLLIRFLKRMIRSSQKKILLIINNLRVNHGKLLQEWLTENKAFIEIFYLPSNSPELNPDELLNRDLKAVLSKAPTAKRNGELEGHAKSYMRSIQKQPEKIKALFHKESVKYADRTTSIKLWEQ